MGRRVTTDANDADPYDYRRQHIYNYLDAVYQVEIPHSETSITTPFVGAEVLISGNVTTNLSDVSSAFPNLDMKFKSGRAIKIGIRHFEKVSFGAFYLGINYKKWSLGASEYSTATIQDVRYRFVEPENSTTLLAFDAGLLF